MVGTTVRHHDRMRRLLVAALLLLSCCARAEALPGGTLEVRTTGGEVSLRVEIAETPAAREQGLMGRKRLAPGAGMVFLFDRPTTVGFWMKDTLIPLDIAFWSPGGRIVAILQMAPCRSDPCRLYAPGVAYTGAVEANRGFFARLGVEPGATARLVRGPAGSSGR